MLDINILIFLLMQNWDNQNEVPHFHHDVTKKYAKINFRIVIYFNCRKITEGMHRNIQKLDQYTII